MDFAGGVNSAPPTPVPQGIRNFLDRIGVRNLNWVGVVMGYSAPQSSLFSLLPKAKTPWTEFVFSTGTQAGLVALVLWLRVVSPVVFQAPEHAFRSIRLVDTPVPVDHTPQPVRELRKPVIAHEEITAEVAPPVNVLRLPAPQPKTKRLLENVHAPSVTVAPQKMDALAASPSPVIPKVVATNVFSTGSSASPTTARPAAQVQTGGFGDPNGIPAKATANQTQAVNIAAKGSFDLPSGPGYGNGSGGAKGSRGVVVSSGFGNGVAIGSSNNAPAAPNTVQASGFGDASVATTPTHSHAADATISSVGAEILSKPTPVYTQEARQLRIEGEVLLEVVLGAAGNLRVLRVVRGLGHGLDDNAVRAAEQIRFKPAMRNGQPADSTVVLHVVFQLA
jgi:TonB family protein